MESLTLVLVSDPTKTRTVSPKSWQHWSKIKGLDPAEFRGGAGTEVWRLVDEDFLKAAKNITAAPRRPIQMPEEIRVIRAAPVAEAVPEPVAEVVTEAAPEVVEVPKEEPANESPKPPKNKKGK